MRDPGHKSGWLKRFARALAAAREAKSVTQAQLAEACGVHKQTAYLWEAGRQAPDAFLLAMICHTLGVKADALIGA